MIVKEKMLTKIRNRIIIRLILERELFIKVKLAKIIKEHIKGRSNAMPVKHLPMRRSMDMPIFSAGGKDGRWD